MRFKSFLNFFFLNVSIIYLSSTIYSESTTEFTFKVLLYSYFVGTLFSLIRSEFLNKLFHHHDLSFFSCSNVHKIKYYENYFLIDFEDLDYINS